MVTKEMICAAHDICLKKGDFVLSASLLERIYLAMRDKADGRDSAGWDAYEDLRKASDEMVLNLRQRVAELEDERDAALARLSEERDIWDGMLGDAADKIAHLELELDDCLYVLDALWDKQCNKIVTQKWAEILIRNKRDIGALSAGDSCQQSTE